MGAVAISGLCLSAVPALAESPPVIVLAAGDISYCELTWPDKIIYRIRDKDPRPERGAPRTAELLDRLAGTILVLGDIAYKHGSAEQFEKCFDPIWGRHKDRMWPVPGNHEYRSDFRAQPYFAYWGPRAGKVGRGYYSFDLGSWHIVGLNSNIKAKRKSKQIRWLRKDLSTTKARCILAFWHHPLFSTGHGGDDRTMAPAYRVLYEAGASVVLAGHDHNYERLAPLDPEGVLDPAYGIRGFVVGTGGAPLTRNGFAHPRAHSEVINSQAWGVLKLTLHVDRYDWEFVPVEGHRFSESGSESCVPRQPPPQIAQ